MNRCFFCGYIGELEEYHNEFYCRVCASTFLRHMDDRLLAKSIAYLINVFIDASGIGAKVDAAFDRQIRLDDEVD